MQTHSQTVADAIREATSGVQRAIEEGHRSKQIDADDVVEIFLSIADLLDPALPDFPEHVF